MINPHPGLPEFDYIKPATLQEASQFLAQHAGEARPILGGTDCFVRMRDGFWKDKYLVDVKGLDGTTDLTFSPEHGLTIGAAVNMNRVSQNQMVKDYYPLLAQAAESVASYQLRSRATVVGNICNASPAGDTIGACLAYQGILHVHGTSGVRQVPLAGFFKGPGKTTLTPGDIVTAISFPLPPQKNAGKYIKLGRNTKSDLSIVGVSVMGYPDNTAPSGFRFRMALASVAPIPLVPSDAEKILAEKMINEETIAAAAQAAMDACNPISDVRGSARYRKYMVRNLVRQAVQAVYAELCA